MLRLDGPNGALDIVTVYFDTGDAASSRREAMSKIADRLRAHDQALTLIFGDFNFVNNECVRWNKRQSKWSGDGDHADQKAFQELLVQKHSLHEVFQPHLTCDMGTARSKIDRIYSNHDIADQLDRQYSCTALLWTSLSAHRPISFSRISPSQRCKTPPLPTAPLNHPEWSSRVNLDYQDLCRADTDISNPLRRLVLMKRSVHTVTRRM